MYEELVKRLRKRAINLKEKFSRNAELLSELMEAADAIEELSKPRWIPVTETKKPKAYEPVMVVYIGFNDALPHRDCTAYWSEDEDLWRWAETNDKVKVPITHYMPLPSLPEPPKEEK